MTAILVALLLAQPDSILTRPLPRPGQPLTVAAPALPAGWHRHQCPKCATVWSHGPGAAVVSHNCPACGTYQNVVSGATPTAFQVSRDTAKALNVPLLLRFGKPGCVPCSHLKAAMKRVNLAGYILLDVDGEKDVALRRQFKVTSYPTLVRWDVRSGAKLSSSGSTLPPWLGAD